MIYILKFSPRFYHAQYYIGYVDDMSHFNRRLREHVKGRGAKITAAAKKAGCELKVCIIIPDGTRQMERKLKRQKCTPRIVRRLERQGYGI